jgi:hypothetical protein
MGVFRRHHSLLGHNLPTLRVVRSVQLVLVAAVVLRPTQRALLSEFTILGRRTFSRAPSLDLGKRGCLTDRTV